MAGRLRIIALLLFAVTGSVAAWPLQLNGVVEFVDGQSASGAQAHYAFYDSPAGGSLLGQSSSPIDLEVSRDSGYFTVAIEVPPEVDATQVYVELEVRTSSNDPWDTLLPRIGLDSPGTAFSAASTGIAEAVVADGVTGESFEADAVRSEHFTGNTLLPRGADLSCPEGQHLGGFSATGAPVCRQLAAGPPGATGPAGPISITTSSFAVCFRRENGGSCTSACGSRAVVVQQANEPCVAMSDGGECSLETSAMGTGRCCICRQSQ